MAMALTTGQEVWIAFATGFSTVTGGPAAQVSHGIVIDGENRVVKRDNGYVSVLAPHSVEQAHPTEAAAWAANADMLGRWVEAVEAQVGDCQQKAAEAAAKAEVVTAGGGSV